MVQRYNGAMAQGDYTSTNNMKAITQRKSREDTKVHRGID